MPSIPLARASAVLVQFSFAKASIIPTGLSGVDVESEYEHFLRKANLTGECMIERDNDLMVDLSNLHTDLALAGYVLVSGFAQERFNKKKPETPYYMIRFRFMLEGRLPLSYQRTDPCVPSGFAQLSKMAYWHFRGYLNPADDSTNFVSINVEGRVPRFIGEDSSQPYLRRLRNEQGDQIGKPIPLEADKVACATRESIFLF